MPEYTEEIAKVESVTLGQEDHGILTAMLHLTFGSSGQGAGGYALDQYDKERETRVGTAFGMEWIRRAMLACGVDEWAKIEGRTVLALRDSAKPHDVAGIKPLPTEPGEPFIFADLAAEFFSKVEA